MPGAHTGIDVPKLAHSYRRLVLWFGVQLLVNALSFPLSAIRTSSTGAIALSVIQLFVLLVTVVALSLYAFRIAAASSSKAPVLWAVAMLIPCLNGITLLALSARSTSVCRAAGIPVGLLGPRLPVAPPPTNAADPS